MDGHRHRSREVGHRRLEADRVTKRAGKEHQTAGITARHGALRAPLLLAVSFIVAPSFGSIERTCRAPTPSPSRRSI
jgi:hypothetical protein